MQEMKDFKWGSHAMDLFEALSGAGEAIAEGAESSAPSVVCALLPFIPSMPVIALPVTCPIADPMAICATPDRNPGCCTGVGMTAGADGAAAVTAFLAVVELLLGAEAARELNDEREEEERDDDRPGAMKM